MPYSLVPLIRIRCLAAQNYNSSNYNKILPFNYCFSSSTMSHTYMPNLAYNRMRRYF